MYHIPSNTEFIGKNIKMGIGLKLKLLGYTTIIHNHTMKFYDIAFIFLMGNQIQKFL